MKLTVFGGTGGTGRALLRLALADSHEVTAVVRDPSALPEEPGLAVRKGDVLDPASLAGTVDGADAVLSTLGGRAGRAETTVYSRGTGHILDAMGAAGVTRLVVISAAPLAPGAHRSVLERAVVDRLLYQFFGAAYRDMARMEALLRTREDVAWTVLRPPRLTDKPGTDRYRTAVEARLPRGWAISRTDLARAMLAALDDPATVRAAVAVAD